MMVILKTYHFLIILLHFNNLCSYYFFISAVSVHLLPISCSMTTCCSLYAAGVKYYTKEISKCYESFFFLIELVLKHFPAHCCLSFLWHGAWALRRRIPNESVPRKRRQKLPVLLKVSAINGAVSPLTNSIGLNRHKPALI